MPFKSEKQRRYLYSQKPEVAKKFAAHSDTHWLKRKWFRRHDDSKH